MYRIIPAIAMLVWALFIIIVLACIPFTFAHAQTCPTRPPGDSSNACASTAFVQGAVTTTGGVQSLNGLTGALNLLGGTGINVTSSGVNITITNTDAIIASLSSGMSVTKIGAVFQVTNTGVTGINGQGGAFTATAGVTNVGTALKLDPNYISTYSDCTVVGSVAANALTVSVRDSSGAVPSATSPCLVRFRSATSGGLSAFSITSATTFTTGTTGSSFGANVNIPFRLWVTVHNNAGTPVVGVSNRSTSTQTGVQVFPLNPGSVQSTTGCNGCTNANTAGVFYTTSSLTSQPMQILGYLDWASGLAVPGVWASTPTGATAFNEGIRKPGEVVQTVYAATTTVGNTTSATYAALTSGQTSVITPSSSINLIRATSHGTIASSASAVVGLQIIRGVSVVGLPALYSDNAATTQAPVSLLGWDAPSTSVGITYGFQGKVNSGTLTYPSTGSGSVLELQEIQG